jgi:hypothetical protein
MDENKEKEAVTPTIEFNAWLTAVESQLSRYSDGQKIQAVEHLYRNIFLEMEAKVKAAKAATTLAELTFEKLSYRVLV